MGFYQPLRCSGAFERVPVPIWPLPDTSTFVLCTLGHMLQQVFKVALLSHFETHYKWNAHWGHKSQNSWA